MLFVLCPDVMLENCDLITYSFDYPPILIYQWLCIMQYFIIYTFLSSQNDKMGLVYLL